MESIEDVIEILKGNKFEEITPETKQQMIEVLEKELHNGVDLSYLEEDNE